MPQIIRVLVNKITPQRWRVKLELNHRQSFKHIEVLKTNMLNKIPVFINTEKLNNIMM